MRPSLSQLLLIAVFALPLTVLGAQLSRQVGIVGQWTFTYHGAKRFYQFNDNQTFSGHYPVSGKEFSGNWTEENGKVILYRQSKSGPFGSVTLQMVDDAEYSAEGYKMIGHRLQP